VRAFGRFAVRIVDPAAAFSRFARAGAPSPDDFRQRAGRMLSGRFGAALSRIAADRGADFPMLLADLPALGDAASALIAPGLREAGLDLRRFHVENVTTPLDVPRVTGTLRQTRSHEAVRLSPCGECLTPVPSTAKFCPKCGVARRRACGCGGELPERAKFCPECGRAV
jgi:membrane protease subunit (stomatin/prohibitin family)